MTHLILAWFIVVLLTGTASAITGRVANLHRPRDGVDHDLALWAIALGVVANLLGFGLFMFMLGSIFRT